MLTDTTLNLNNVLNFEMNINITNYMLMHDLEVLCNEPWCCILCWQFDMQFSYATHLAHPVLCRPTHFNISGYASAQTIQDGDSMDNIPGYNASERHSQLNSIG